MGSELDDISQRTGASVEAISSLGFAAGMAGSSLEELEASLKKQAAFLANAAAGGKAQNEVLQQLGLTISDLAKLRPEDQFRLLGQRIAAIPNPTLRAAAAMDVFGKTGANLIPVFAELGKQEERAKQLGLIVSSEDAQAAASLGDAWAELVAVGKALVFNVGAALGPALTDLVTWVAETGAKFIAVVKANRGYILSIAKIAAIVVTAGGALIAFGATLTGIGTAVGAAVGPLLFFGRVLNGAWFAAGKLFSLLTTSIGTIWGVVAKAVMGVASAIASALTGAFSAAGGALASLLTPIGVLGIALVGLGAYFIYASGIIGSSIDALRQYFRDLLSDGLQAFDGIRDALAAGDLGAAMKVAAAYLSLEWQRALLALKELWVQFKEFFLSTWDEAVARLARFFLNGVALIENAWTQTVDYFADGWYGWLSIVTQSWNSTIGFLMKTWLKLKGLFDDSIDVDAEIKKIDDATNKKNRENEDALGDRTLARQKKREAELKRIEQERIDSLAAIEQMKDEAAKARAIKNAEEIAARERALMEARDAFKESIDDAAKKRKDFETKKPGERKSPFPGLPGLPDLESGTSKLRTAVSGTFSAAAAKGLGGNRQLDAIALNTKQTAAGIKKLAKQSGGIPVS
jgi:hypothetical protein